MFELMNILDTSYKSVASDMKEWFAPYPAGAAWNVFSDYCIGDQNKQNDTFSFVILLNHDTRANIENYIANVAPRDLKNSRQSSLGLISYLKSPVVFSITYVVGRQSKLLRDYISKDAILGGLSDTLECIEMISAQNPATRPYWSMVGQRIKAVQKFMGRSSPNVTLIRKMYLVSAFAAVLFKHLNVHKEPYAIRWISDRDSIMDCCDGVAFDMAFFYFLQIASNQDKVFNQPLFHYATPGMDGVTEYNEFIRLPDYLAGTLADLDLTKVTFTRDKYWPIFSDVIYDSPNKAVIEVLGDINGITSRRIGWGGGLR